MLQTINATFVKALPTQEGDSQRGHWVRGGAIVEYGDTYPRQLAITLFGEDRVAMAAAIAPGTPVQVAFAPESREHNGRWYTDLRGVTIAPAPQQQPAPQQPTPRPEPHFGPATRQYLAQPQQPAQAAPAQQSIAMPQEDNDLPF